MRSACVEVTVNRFFSFLRLFWLLFRLTPGPLQPDTTVELGPTDVDSQSGCLYYNEYICYDVA
jgi:hypothetical protein